MNVRVLDIRIQAPIGDELIAPVAEAALQEYFAACRAGRAGHAQDETFMCCNGVRITTAHSYRWQVGDR